MISSFSDILNGKLCQFKINSEEDVEPDWYSDDENDDIDEGRNIQIQTQIDLPFADMKQDMIPIDHGIYKRILTEGSGDKLTGNSRIRLDYSGFWEGNSSPFETTWINRHPKLVKFGDDMLPGLCHALLSMRQGEVAKFIIPYQLLYGALGCEMASIPQKADGLYIVRLISFEDVGNTSAIDEEFIDQYATYAKVLERVAEVRKSAQTNFVDGRYEQAVADYEKCIAALKFCRDADEKDRSAILEKMHVNICVCYNKLDRPKQVLRVYNELTNNELARSCKGLFQVGRAHFKEGSYDAAVKFLAKAQALEPNNREIAQEMKLVNVANLKYKDDIKEISEKAFQRQEKKDVPRGNRKGKRTAEQQECYDLLEAYVKKFIDDPKKSKQVLPISLSPSEVEQVEEIANVYHLKIESKTENNEVLRYLVKPATTTVDN